MQAHRAESTVSGDGSVTVQGVPFPEGEEVEVIVLPRPKPSEGGSVSESLRGSVRAYDEPFEAATAPMRPSQPLSASSKEARVHLAAANENRWSESDVDSLVEGLVRNGFSIAYVDRSGTNSGSWIIWANRSGVQCSVWFEGRDIALGYRVGEDGPSQFLDMLRRTDPEELVQLVVSELEGGA